MTQMQAQRCLVSGLLALALLVAGAAVPQARAEIALLANGQTLKVSGHRIEGRTVYLSLPGGGEVGTASAQVRGFVPDELAEVLAEVAAAERRGAGDPEQLRGLVVEVARRHGLEPSLVLAVVEVESAFRPEAVSAKGARGLMQLMPGTARELGVEDAFDPEANVDGGVRHLRDLLERYDGDLPLTLAAYNAGAGAVQRHDGVPPFAETRAYVREVLRRYAPHRP